MLGPAYKTWPENASSWSHRVDTRQPWVSSPQTADFPLPGDAPPVRPVIPPLRHRRGKHKREEGEKGKHSGDDLRTARVPRSWLLSFWRWCFNKMRKVDRQDLANWPSLQSRSHIVTPSEWRAYGYWARPNIDGIVVHNATPPAVPRELGHEEIEEVFQSLRDSDGFERPENWIPRLEHPSLPPRPALWPTPTPSLRSLPPNEIQLNPFLRHRPFGRPPILFDMRVHQATVWLGELPAHEGDTEPWRVPFFSEGPNGSQPATYPPVCSLHISALADDQFPKFPWPMTVVPHHPSLPVLVKHVLNACIANFEERMTQEEVDALSEERRDQTFRSYWNRVQRMVGGRVPGDDDGLRRIDYLGDSAFFRGLEPAPDGNGFMLFVGQP